MAANTTPSKPKTRMSAEDRRNAIIFAAIPVFAKKGFSGTTTKELAQAAGVSEALLYRHFPSKESMYADIQEQICETNSVIGDFIHGLEPSSEAIVTMTFVIFKIIFESTQKHPLGNSIPRLMVQSLLEDGEFARSFHQPRFNKMLPCMEAAAKVAIAKGEVVPGPINHVERQWFPHHLAVSLRLSDMPNKSVFDYESNPEERLLHAVWFSLRGLGMKDKIIQRHLKPEKLHPLIEDVLYRAGMRSAPQN